MANTFEQVVILVTWVVTLFSSFGSSVVVAQLDNSLDLEPLRMVHGCGNIGVIAQVIFLPLAINSAVQTTINSIFHYTSVKMNQVWNQYRFERVAVRSAKTNGCGVRT